MRLTDAQIRRIVSEALRITNAPRVPIGPGEPSSRGRDNTYFSLLGKESQKQMRDLKRNFVLDPAFNSWYKIHWESHDDIVGELTRWNPRLEKSVSLYRTREAIGHNPIPESGIKLDGYIGLLIRGGRITAMYDDDPMTEYTETPSGWRYYAGGDVTPDDDSTIWAARGTKGEKWTMTPEDALGSEWEGRPLGEYFYEATVVGGTPEAIVIRNPELLGQRYKPERTRFNPIREPGARSVQELVDILFSLDIPVLDASLQPLSYDRLMSLVS